MRYTPPELLPVVRVPISATLDIAMVTPDRAAPLASVIVPVIAPAVLLPV
jgi:hypothetical protein